MTECKIFYNNYSWSNSKIYTFAEKAIPQCIVESLAGKKIELKKKNLDYDKTGNILKFSNQ